MEAPGLRPLDAGQLTELLTPAVQALLDTAPRQAQAGPLSQAP
jgi:hypothetical protein